MHISCSLTSHDETSPRKHQALQVVHSHCRALVIYPLLHPCSYLCLLSKNGMNMSDLQFTKVGRYRSTDLSSKVRLSVIVASAPITWQPYIIQIDTAIEATEHLYRPHWMPKAICNVERVNMSPLAVTTLSYISANRIAFGGQ
jgi:hypothetical protein